MKLVKNFLFAVLLVSAIAVNTPAGEQDIPGYAAPPPPPRQMITTDETPVCSSDTEHSGEIVAKTSDYFIFEALTALLSVY